MGRLSDTPGDLCQAQHRAANHSLLWTGMEPLSSAGRTTEPCSFGLLPEKTCKQKKTPSKGLFSMQPFPVAWWLLFCGAVIVHSVRQQSRTKAGRKQGHNKDGHWQEEQQSVMCLPAWEQKQGSMAGVCLLFDKRSITY